MLDPDPSGVYDIYPLTTLADKSAYHGTMHYGTLNVSQFLGMLVVMLARGQGWPAAWRSGWVNRRFWAS